MTIPRYIESKWHGQGMAVLKFTYKDDDMEKHSDRQVAEVGKIKCCVSSLHIMEYARKPSIDADESRGDEASQNSSSSEQQLPRKCCEAKIDVCPPGVSNDIWQSWLMHWESWKDIYIPLSWVHKYRELCSPEYVEWHDSYLEEYSWIIPYIADELGDSDCELINVSYLHTEQKDLDDAVNVKDETIQSDCNLGITDSHDQNISCELNLLENKSQQYNESEKCKIAKNNLNSLAEVQYLQENSPGQSVANKNIKKEVLDSLYEKHSEKRYWVHLRNFLYTYNFDIDADGVNDFFLQNAGIHFDRSRILNTNEQELANTVADKSRTIDNFADQVETEYNIKISLQESTGELDYIKTEEQNEGHILNNENQIQTNETNELEDINDDDMKKHYHRTSYVENNSEMCLNAAQFENNSNKLVSSEPTQGEDTNVNCKYLNVSETNQSDDPTQDDGSAIKSLVSEQLDQKKTDADFFTEKQSEDEAMTQVRLDINETKEEQTVFENSTFPFAPSGVKHITKKKKKKQQQGLSRHTAGLGWALKYIQYQDDEIRQNGDDNQSLEGPSMFSEDFQENVNFEASEDISINNELLLDENRGCSSNEVDMTQFEEEGSIDENLNSSEGGSGCAIINFPEKNDHVSSAESPEDVGDKDQTKTGLTSSKIIAGVGRFVATSVLHILDTIFPAFPGEIFKLPFQVLWPLLSSTVLSRESQEQSPLYNTVETLEEKRRNHSDKKQRKLYKWLRSLSYFPPSSTLNPVEGVVLTTFHIQPEDREDRRVYYSVEKTVADDGTSMLNLQALNLLENIQMEDSFQAFSTHGDDNHEEWTRTHITFDEEGNFESSASVKGYLKTQEAANHNPETTERSAWREMTAEHQLVNYGVTDESPPPDVPQEVHKYWAQRHRLFIKYDEGIKLDQESWYSVTPELIAAHHANRCRCDVVVDAFCGAGGNAIQLAMTCNYVIAIDIDPVKIALARHNAAVYGVADRIEFIIGDFFQLVPRLKADVIYLSPPWGGIEYFRDGTYDVRNLGGVFNCEELLATARTITTDIALYLPRTSNLYQIIELAGIGGTVDIELNHMGRKKKALTAYFGDLAYY
nr:uncharacterized protein LOC128685346 isoform X2 [Cherax quadricarinatus]